jgi:uncharacterized LabA/DUF88 family protein
MINNTYVFIDSSNLFYGGIRRLGWRVDYDKLARYLRNKYGASKIFYYSGIETHNYDVELNSQEPYPIKKLLKHLTKIDNIERDIARAKFLRKIESFGYILRLKPIKRIRGFDGAIKMKANCDVDLTFDLVRLVDEYDRAILLSGDGDFEILLRYLSEMGKDFIVMGKSHNTARTIKDKYKRYYRDFEEIVELVKENGRDT